MPAHILHHVRIKDGIVSKDGVAVTDKVMALPEDLYRELGCNYLKFFKMDPLCKWAWLATELLVSHNGQVLYHGLDNNRVALVLQTTNGCLEVDKKYQETLATIPSPALFVYTLPNIMLGEICIRHGFKGEQACLVNEAFDSEELTTWVADLLERRGMEACLFGRVDATRNATDITLFWADSSTPGTPLSAPALQQVHEG